MSLGCIPAGRIRLAEDLDVLSRAEIDRLREWNLAAMLEAAAASPALRQRLAGVGSVRHAADLRRLPLLSPADLAELCPPHSSALLLGDAGPGLVLRSSGTSGRRKVLYHSWPFTSQVGVLGARGLRSALESPPRRLANCMHAGELNGSYTFVELISMSLPTLMFPCGSEMNPEELAQVIEEHEVDAIAAVPAAAADLILRTAPKALASVRTLLYLGEELGEQRAREITAAAPDLVIRSLAYTASETGPIGYQCAYSLGTTHHIHEDAVIVEVIDGQTGEPLPDGQPGELVVTPLADTGMAMFRYRIGDRGMLHPQECACGSQARLLTLLGRADQSIKIDTNLVSGDLLMARLAAFGITHPMDCQFQVLWDGPATFTRGVQSAYRIRLLVSEAVSADLAPAAVKEELCKAYHLESVLHSPRCAEFTVEKVAPTHFSRSGRGKAPLFYQA